MIRFTRDILVPAAVLAAGAGTASYIFRTAPSEAETQVEASATPVKVVTVQTVNEAAQIRTTGRVEPARQIKLVPEVGGRLVSLSDDLVPGGRFLEGDEIGKIDPREYRMGLLSEESRVSQAELELALETERGSAAAREWQIVHDAESTENRLALREPHLEAAEKALTGAEQNRARARLNLDRTRILAPFNAVVVDEAAEIGQVVSSASPVATLVGTDHFRVKTSIPIEQLSLFQIPGATATVTQEVGTEIIERQGVVERLSSTLDSSSQTAQVWIRVADPLDPGEGQLPLLAGSFVRVEIAGLVQPVQVVPRAALYEGRYTWTINESEQLERVELEISWADDKNVYVSGGVSEGDRLISSPISLPMNGMKVEVIE